MEKLGMRFEFAPSEYEEDINAYEDPAELAKFLALEKAKSLAENFPDSVIIGADTFVTLGNKKIGKPGSIEEAREIIRSMGNNTVNVHSGVAVIRTNHNSEIIKKNARHAVTNITFEYIGEKDIERIIKTDDVLAISGAFSIEGAGGKFVKEIDGDYDNVIGLPIFLLKEMLSDAIL